MSLQRNRSRRQVAAIRIAQLGLGAIVLLGWELAARYGVIDEFFFSRPGDIAVRLGDWFGSGSIWRHMRITVLEAALGLGIGGVAGLVLGFALARMRFVAAVVEPYVRMGNALPRVVLAPIFLLWFGLGIWSKVALGVSLVVFIVFFNTYQGVREVDQLLVDNARMLGATERQLWRYVLLPSALTWILASLRLSVGFAVIGAVVGEYLGAADGLGYLIAQAEGTFDTTGVFAGIAVLCAVVVVVDVGADRAERHLLRWQPVRGTAITKGKQG
ncbi:ABC transporter permease [Nocardia brasiliensis]|uniref:Binding-protein-dependent transport systems inner membrane component n=1 Tax=Nocardia brasiliensis (strain ATCC 700358 / HUJEG-1) TaxID=1133849 RepID=K0ERW3_NOCB7|nr:ABC transporter permease [Nocardia brasiliensis]AFU02553.1 binding-protein-dependent transport systems inner membrane component [Nocardia brasiliensis ATCC 700358]OCF86507.1 ABC transporter permease [Nocardia brasiliensis]